MNPHLGNTGHSDHRLVLGETGNDLDGASDLGKPVNVSVGLGSRDAVNAMAIVIWNDFVQGDRGEPQVWGVGL